MKEGEPLTQSQLNLLDDIYRHFDSSQVTSAEKEFVELVQFTGIKKLIQSLKTIHDFALYHTDICFDTADKQALFDLKILWEGLERMDGD